ncbi:ABC-transporter DevC family protein [Scytonema sp. HK-05]|uniref:ABC transporter permease DevC n=1 Tax=Scytonema sp. HK-05 TaxID=1137095 RepID=UPI0009366905|nr:ABC transporter permease DevC [Scytonema sp. HK-05]OKH52900.1 ABC transporter [Scytonema sp. HK-05]BAY49695.1 ABC-transporter DevC family protein [Scytonema sp. HK-05]
MFRKLFRKTPLAWLQMSHEKARLLVAIAGIAFADLLMFVQLGMKDALNDGQVQFYTKIRGDLFLVNKLSDNLTSLKSFSRENLYQARGIDGVASVSSLYIGQVTWRNPENQTSRQIYAYGIDPNQSVLNFPEVNQHLEELKLLNRALFDKAARLPKLGDVPTLLKKENPLSVQVNNLEIQIVGLFALGSSFAAEGNLITSDSTFLRLFTERQPDKIDVGVVKVKSNATIKGVQAKLQAIVPDDLLVLTLDEFADRERAYWTKDSPIGIIFGLGVVLGFLVGVVIVYQILYTDISNHLPEYATLKAMGYSDVYFIGVVIQEALILAALGFVPGVILSTGLYTLTRSATLLPIAMKLSRATLVLVLTIVMCIGAGAIALRKLQQADPADIF